MTTELIELQEDARLRQVVADWTNALLRLRSRPIRSVALRTSPGAVAAAPVLAAPIQPALS